MSVSLDTVKTTIKNIPNTTIPTLTYSKKEGDSFHLYISEIRNKGRDIILKPIGTNNLESLKTASTIIKEKRLAIITLGKKALNLFFFEELLPKAPKEGIKLFLEVDMKQACFGQVEHVEILKNECFGEIAQLPFEIYVRAAVKAINERMAKQQAAAKK